MTVVVKRKSDGRVFCFTKGAESGIYPLLRSGQMDENRTTVDHLHDFAMRGLRTLVFAWKEFPIGVSEEKIQAMKAGDIECNLELLGVTGLEDKLQTNV